MDVERIPVTDFTAQIAHCNAIRAASGLPPLDTDEAVRAVIREWNCLLAEARTRLREMAGRDLADNHLTYMLLAREVAPRLRAYFASLTTSAMRVPLNRGASENGEQ